MEHRQTVGFLVSGIMDDFIVQLCRGVIEEANKYDTNVVVIPIKYINREMRYLPDVYEYQYQTSTHYLSAENLDVLIVAADCIGCQTTLKNLENFMKKIKEKGIPIILAASKMDGYSGVIFDNRSGILEGLNYLIEELGITNICMLKSMDSNADVNERSEAFKQVLKDHGIKIKSSTIINAPVYGDCIEESKKLLDLNPNVEAVFCANDEIAMNFYGVMRDRGLTPGKDIKVMGFDNSACANMVIPSLTTVDANPVHLGERVFRMARMAMEGWEVGKMSLPTRFILRDSFGSLLDSQDAEEKIFDKNYLDEYFRRVFFKFEEYENQEEYEFLIMFKSLISIIIDYVNDQQYSPERVRFLKNKVDEFFKTDALNYTSVDVLIAYVNSLKNAAINRFENAERKCQALETYSTILEKVVKTLSDRITQEESKYDAPISTLKVMVEDTLNLDIVDDEYYTNILVNLARFGVKNAFLYVYEKPILHENKRPFRAPDKLLLKTIMTSGKIKPIPPEDQVIYIDEMYNNKFIPDRKFNRVVMPLYFQNTVYGCLLYDLTDITYKNGEFLAKYYSITVRIIDKIRKLAEAKQIKLP